jgi:hypothetical protein
VLAGWLKRGKRRAVKREHNDIIDSMHVCFFIIEHCKKNSPQTSTKICGIVPFGYSEHENGEKE